MKVRVTILHPLVHQLILPIWRLSLCSSHIQKTLHCATSIATYVHAKVTSLSVMDKLRESWHWWTLTKSLTGIASKEHAFICSLNLADYSAIKLCSYLCLSMMLLLNLIWSILLMCSNVNLELRSLKSIIMSLHICILPSSYMGDDDISPKVLRHCMHLLVVSMANWQPYFIRFNAYPFFHLPGRSIENSISWHPY